MAGRVKVTNISKHVDKEILSKLFGFIGSIGKVDVRQSEINPEVQEAVVEFEDASCVKAAMFLGGTDLADRALVVIDDLAETMPITPTVAIPAIPVMPRSGAANAVPLANPAVVAQMAGRVRSVQNIPANIAALIHPSIMQYDPVKAEEISRTVYVGNIATRVMEQELMDFFSACGPVAYVKMAGDGLQPTRFAFVEFAELATAQAALQMNGMRLADRPLKVNHSKNAINKPSAQQPLGVRGLLGQQRVVPTLAAVASLPSSMDPVVAAMNQQQQHRSGLAWPVLGDTNPTATSPMDTKPAAQRESSLERKLRGLQTEMEAKYADRRPVESRMRRDGSSRSRSQSRPRRSRVRSPSPHRSRESSRRGHRDRMDREDYGHRSSRRSRDEDRYGRRHRSRSSERHRHHRR